MAFQIFMIAPTGASSITHTVQMGAEVYQELKNVVKAKQGCSGKFQYSMIILLCYDLKI